MKILSASQMREIDRLTIERGIAGLILMENAGCRVVDSLVERFSPLADHHIVVVCGKGNNGGDGFVVARQLFSRRLCRELTVVELFDPADLTGDAKTNRMMLDACGCTVERGFKNEPSAATLVVDAVLGTGLSGPVKPGPALEAIQAINQLFPLAKKISVDLPSGAPFGESVRADHTVTFVAPKVESTEPFTVAAIGTPPELIQSDLNRSDPADFRHLFVARSQDSNKGMYGHVLVVGGSFGKSGAPAMCGLAAYRSGAGLVTIATPEKALTAVASFRPELMTEPLPAAENAIELTKKMTVLAVGPGFGTGEESVRFVKTLYKEAEAPGVFDADALNILAEDLPRTDKIRILTPHPGEMGRLVGKSVKEVQADRLGIARSLAATSGAAIVLKGDRTVIAYPDGEAWINPTGSPSMATGGTGDILTGMIAGLVGQHPKEWKVAVVAAVWLHGRCGELGAKRWGEQSMLATDLLEFLPDAIREVCLRR